MTLHIATFAQLTPATLYGLLRLRVDVFVVEQKCPYRELDGRDTEPGTRHVWLADGDDPVAYLRMLSEPDGTARVGRVCVAAGARGRGLARVLMRDALEHIGPVPCVLDAQAYLTGFYVGLGFTPTGPEFADEDGIPHVPMVKGAPQGSVATSSAIERR